MRIAWRVVSVRTPAAQIHDTPEEPAQPRPQRSAWLVRSSQYSWSTIGRYAEFTYVVVALAALTQGPVLTLWTRQTQPGQLSSDYAILSTYLAVQMPALALLARRGLPGRGRAVVVAGIVVLVGWLSLSTVWSTVHIDTATAVVALVATTCFGLYLAVSYSSLELVTLIVIGMQAGLLVSGWSVARHWQGSRDPIGNWVGIFFNRNSLGPPAVIASAGVVVLVAVLVRRRPPLWWCGVAVLLAVGAFDLRLQLHGDSATSWMVLAVFVGSWTLWQIAGIIARRVRDDGRIRSARTLGIGYFCVVSVVTVTALVERNRVSAWLGRPPEFDGRGLHWSANWAGVQDRPFFGWGWLAAWHTPEFRVRLSPEIANDIWSHSAYFDLLLGGGVVAAGIFVAIVVAAFAGLADMALRVPLIGALPVALATAILVANTQESFIIGNHFLWALLVAALCAQPWAANGRSVPIIDVSLTPDTAPTSKDEQ